MQTTPLFSVPSVWPPTHFYTQKGGGILKISSYGEQVAVPGNSLYHNMRHRMLVGIGRSGGCGMTIIEPRGAHTKSAMATRY